MRLFFIFIYLSYLVSARRQSYEDNPSDEIDEHVSFVDTVLDLRGSVRKLFALEAAFVDHVTNMICSPVSVLMPLGKLALGAEKNAERELLAALGLKSRKQIPNAFAQMITNLEYLPGVTLDVASRIFINSEQSINKKFLKRTKTIFKSSCQKINAREPHTAAQQINEWVSSKTRRKIKKLIDPADIQKETSLILVNAIYFAGTWKDKFGSVYTDDFHTPYGSRRIPMMTREGEYNYWKCDTLNAQLIEIPYEGEESAMIIVLPFTKTGLPILLRALKLAPELLNQALEKMKTANVLLSMPKFKIETELNLNSLLQKIGIESIFRRRNTGLTGVMNNEEVRVTKSIHKAVIEVNERGTEAAAATGIVATYLSAHVSIKFNVDHQFLFFVRAYQEQLFAGIYSGV